MTHVRRRISLILLVLLIVGAITPAASARAGWKKRIDRIIGGSSMSVSVTDGRTLYRHSPTVRRAPASGEKLLLTMALLDEISADSRIKTKAAAKDVSGGVVLGDLWLLGRGDPTITGGGSYGKSLPFSPTRLSRLARKVVKAGVTRVTGSVVGSTGYYARDWWARGWKSDFPREEVALPSALTYEGNKARGRHISDPEVRAARSLTKRLEAQGVRVAGKPRSGATAAGLTSIAKVSSVPVHQMLRFMNRHSSNFFAEMFGKRLAVERGLSGSIANGSASIRDWAARHGAEIEAYDGSGLSYDNRISAAAFTRLLEYAEGRSHFGRLRSTLAGADEGTLDNRLQGVRLRAKTGTLSYVSSLSGWVWLRQTKTWAAFSIMSNGLYKSTAVSMEDRILRELTRNAR